VKKKKLYGDNLREQLEASSRDQLYSFFLDFGGIRGALVPATRMVNEMRANHELGTLETLLLGHAYIAALPQEEPADILENGPFPVVTTCFNCNSEYEFPRSEIEKMLAEL
jgi:redox-regulated HSP33 family molecular chaperone